MFIARKEHAQAERNFIEATRLAQASEDPFGEAPAWRWLSLTQSQQGKLAEARETMTHARSLYQTMGMTHELATIEKLTASWGD